MDKYEIAQILREIGLLIELSDPYPEKSFGYKRAARAIESVHDLNHLLHDHRLETIPGIGKKTSQMIETLAKTDHLEYYDELKKRVPSTLLELLNIPGLNPKKIRLLHEKLKIQNLEDLKVAIDQDLLKGLKLMPPYAIKKIAKNIESVQTKGFSLLYPKALAVAESLKQALIKQSAIEKITIAGALRRKCELITELCLVVVSKVPEKCSKAFRNHSAVKEIIEETPEKITVRLKYGIKASLCIVPLQNYEWTIFNETGNENHIVEIKKEAKKKKIPHSLLEEAPSEAAIYSLIDLDYIPPELRENQGEIKAAKLKKLPLLINENQLKGALHCHTLDSDGRTDLDDLIQAARDLGWEYIGISDHSKSSYQANGMSEHTLLSQIERIRSINLLLSNFKVLSGLECDILKDGTLDFPNEILGQLDFVIVSVHRYFSMERKEMTKRFIKAIENPYSTIVGHLTGRLLRSREPYELDIKKIIDACVANGKVMELNGTPDRLDLDWRYWIKAKEKGLLCCINPDAHSISDLQYCQYGINIARKGWLEAKDVINTKTLVEMQTFLKR